MEAISKAPEPTNVSQHLGLLQYYSPKLTSVVAPLYKLIKKDVQWKWQAVEQDAFDQFRDVDPAVEFACDASSYGVGAVLSWMVLRDQ